MYILKYFINSTVSRKRNIIVLMDPLLLPAIIKTPTLKKIILEEKVFFIMEKFNYKKWPRINKLN